MAIQLIMLIRANACRDMMEHRRSNHSFRIRQGAARLRSPSRRHSIREGNEDQSERNQTPAVVAHVVELEVVGCEVGLRGWAEPADDHDGVVDPAEAAEAVPECCAVGVGVEDLVDIDELAMWPVQERVLTVEFIVAMVCCIAGVVQRSGRGKQSVAIAMALEFAKPGARTGPIFKQNDEHPSGAYSGRHGKSICEAALHATSL
jgi:hypothetical protein